MDEIKKLLAKYITLPETVTEDSRLIDDLGLDSFLIVYFLSEADDKFHIALDEAEFESFVTVGDVLDRIRRMSYTSALQLPVT